MLNRIEALQELDVQFYFDHVYEDRGEGRARYEVPEVITGANPYFDPRQWVAMAQREGAAYVGGCCGNMSAAQDVVNGAFRDGGFFESSELLTLGVYCRGHEGMEAFEEMTDEQFTEKLGAIKRVQERIEVEADPDGLIVDPWAVLGLIFNATEKVLKPGWMDQPRAQREPRDDDQPDHFEMQRLYGNLHYVDWVDVFSSDQDSHIAQRQVRRARILPAAQELVAKLEALDLDFEGFAIVKPGTDEVLSNRLGDCVYLSRDEAEKVIEIWTRAAADREEGTTGAAVVGEADGEVVPVRVTVENGLEVLRG